MIENKLTDAGRLAGRPRIRGDEITVDVGVVGAGPAGLAAAVTAADAGLSVTLVDAGSQPGGQFWRHPPEGDGTPASDEGAGHHLWLTFTMLRSRLYAHVRADRVQYLPNHQVWLLEHASRSSVLHLTGAWDAAPVRARSIVAERVILCQGGYDRQLPIPGWTLPGVMAAGGVQALIKGNRSVTGRRAVVAGTGPFLLPVATALAGAGVKVVAICEANSPIGWLKNVRGVARVPSKAVEAAEYAAALLRHRIPYRVRTGVTEIHGEGEVDSVSVAKLNPDGAPIPGTATRIDVDLVALGWGFTPSLELALAAGAETKKDVDGSLIAVVDDRMRSRVPGISIAGEATGIGGASMAVHEGELAALAVAAERGLPIPAAHSRRLRWAIRRERAFAVAMHRANPVPANWTAWLTGSTVLCRCEEVQVDAVRAAHDRLGAADPRTMKLLTRTGMGWCQGRVCGFATTEFVAACRSRASTAEDLRSVATRSPAVPVPLGELAELSGDNASSCKMDNGTI